MNISDVEGGNAVVAASSIAASFPNREVTDATR